MSKIYEEAIADAKKLKEVAEESAKKAILESVTPKIRDYIESQLLDQDNNVSNLEETIDLDQKGLKAMSNLLSQKSYDKGDIKEAFDSLSSEDQARMLNIANKINQKEDNFSSSKIDNNNLKRQRKNTLSEKFYEVDLKLLREQIEEEAMAHELSEKMSDSDFDY